MDPLIHIAKIQKNHRHQLLFLRKKEDGSYIWLEDAQASQHETEVHARSLNEAVNLGYKHWHLQQFRPLLCGYKFTLPERDEIGSPALFSQMIKSYSVPNGIVQDIETGVPYIVQNAPLDTLQLWKRLKEFGKL